MANVFSFAPGWVRELGTVLSCWLVLLVALIGQCIANDVFVHQSSARLLTDLLWYLKNWGLWLLVMPALYDFYYRRAQTGGISLIQFAPVALGGCGLLLALEYLLQCLLDPSLNPVSYALYFVPRYSLAILVFTLVWLWRHKTLVASCWQAQRQDEDMSLNLPSDTTHPEFTRVHNEVPAGIVAFKGRDKAFISLADIEGLVAARNYLDIYCPHGEYVVRDTMKNMEARLINQQFVRIHRSALVRLSAVCRFKRLPSGNGIAVLTSGIEIPVSKNFMLGLGKQNHQRMENMAGGAI